MDMHKCEEGTLKATTEKRNRPWNDQDVKKNRNAPLRVSNDSNLPQSQLWRSNTLAGHMYRLIRSRRLTPQSVRAVKQRTVLPCFKLDEFRLPIADFQYVGLVADFSALATRGNLP